MYTITIFRYYTAESVLGQLYPGFTQEPTWFTGE